jgi:hypothetical protein
VGNVDAELVTGRDYLLRVGKRKFKRVRLQTD